MCVIEKEKKSAVFFISPRFRNGGLAGPCVFQTLHIVYLYLYRASNPSSYFVFNFWPQKWRFFVKATYISKSQHFFNADTTKEMIQKFLQCDVLFTVCILLLNVVSVLVRTKIAQSFSWYVFHVIMCCNYRLIITSFSCVLMSESVPEGARVF